MGSYSQKKITLETLHIFQASVCHIFLLTVIAYANAKAVANPEPQYAAGPVSAPLVVNPAKPYSFAYEVIDPNGGNAFGHKESSDGTVVTGEYRVVLPDTRTQIVTYSASAETGYVAEVRYEGTPVFPAVAAKSARLQVQARPQNGRNNPQNGRNQAARAAKNAGRLQGSQ